MRLHYKNYLTQYSKKLRKAGNLSEVLLWEELKRNKLGSRFLRQRPLGKYIVDFFCHSLKLAVEIDGTASHDAKIDHDYIREKDIEAIGVRVLRVKDADVRFNLGGVVEMIKSEMKKSSGPQGGPPPLRKEE